MNRKIYRFDISKGDYQNGRVVCIFECPYKIIKCLKVDTIRGEPSVWCLVDLDGAPSTMKIGWYGTAWDITNDKKANEDNYIGSFIVENAEIYHCFLESLS